MKYPANLNADKPPPPNAGCEYYKLGLCDKAQAEQELQGLR